MSRCKQKRSSTSLEDYLQINAFPDWKKNELTLH